LDAYLQQLKQQGRIVTDKDLSKNDSVALRIEWTRDRIDETLESLKRVDCRIDHWFEEEFFECP
jgi:HKD family nuclease